MAAIVQKWGKMAYFLRGITFKWKGILSLSLRFQATLLVLIIMHKISKILGGGYGMTHISPQSTITDCTITLYVKCKEIAWIVYSNAPSTTFQILVQMNKASSAVNCPCLAFKNFTKNTGNHKGSESNLLYWKGNTT